MNMRELTALTGSAQRQVGSGSLNRRHRADGIAAELHAACTGSRATPCRLYVITGLDAYLNLLYGNSYEQNYDQRPDHAGRTRNPQAGGSASWPHEDGYSSRTN